MPKLSSRKRCNNVAEVLERVTQEHETQLSKIQKQIAFQEQLAPAGETSTQNAELTMLEIEAQEIEAAIADVTFVRSALSDIAIGRNPADAFELSDSSKGRPADDCYYERDMQLATQVGVLVKSGSTANAAFQFVSKNSEFDVSPRVVRSAWQKYKHSVSIQSELIARLQKAPT